MKLSPKDFVKTYLPFAQETQKKTGIHAMAILAQAALESGWGERAVGNMFFGVKDTDGINGNEQLLVTTEYLKSPDMRHLFPEVISVEQVKPNRWKYKVKDWFRKYDTPEGSFSDHAEFFLRNKRYAEALKVGSDPIAFFREIAKAGYATAPAYFEVLTQVVKMVLRHAPPEPPKAGEAQLESFSRTVEAPDEDEAAIPELSAEEIRLLVPRKK